MQLQYSNESIQFVQELSTLTGNMGLKKIMIMYIGKSTLKNDGGFSRSAYMCPESTYKHYIIKEIGRAVWFSNLDEN